MSGRTIISLIIFQIGLCQGSHYLITTSQSIQPGETKIFEVEIFGSKPCVVDFELFAYMTTSKATILGKTSQTIAPGKRVKIPVKISDNWKTYSVFLKGNVCGQNTSEATLTYFDRKAILIQTDKPIYKPGEKVRMRLAFLNQNLKSAGDKIPTVSVVDAGGSRVMQWSDVKLDNGIASLELQLSEEPVLGKWKIVANLDIYEKFEQVIEVKKYVLPKFQVQIFPPPYVALDMPIIKTTICAKYAYGKAVKGKMTTQICSHYDDYGYDVKNCQNFTSDIAGCHDVLLNRDDLKLADANSLHGAKVTIEASVTEQSTGVTQRTKDDVKLHERSVMLSFKSTPHTFKPGMPFQYTLLATKRDGTPVTDVMDVKVKARELKKYSIFYEKTVKVKNGVYKDTLSVPYQAQPISLEAELGPMKYKTSLDSNPEPTDFKAHIHYSPSLSYISLSKPSKPVKIGSNVKLEVTYTVRNETAKTLNIYHDVYCKGSLVKSGVTTRTHPYVTTVSSPSPSLSPLPGSNSYPNLPQLGAPTIETFNIQFPVTTEMTPLCRILVYYVRTDKETVADSVTLDVEQELKNKVSVSFAEKQRKPGEKTKLIIKASPGSRVAFTAVDKSVHILRQGNEITKNEIYKFHKKVDPGPSRNSVNKQCSRSQQSVFDDQRKVYIDDAATAFDGAGVIFLSNLNIFTKPCDAEKPIAGVDGGQNPGEAGKKGGVRTRQNFPETWLWVDETMSASGTASIDVQVPDTITSWVANGFGLSSVTGIGVSDTTELKVFQPFFIQMTLPYSVIRGEETPIKITVFNYMKDCLPVELTLDATSSEYQVTSYNVKKLCVCGDSGQTVQFNIVPKSLGRIKLNVDASQTKLDNCVSTLTTPGDKVIKELLVEPEGIQRQYTQGTFFCPKAGKFNTVFDLTLPRNLVPGSVHSQVTFIGDVMGPALSNLEGLLRMPYGCGEQNMAKFAPNIYIMDYLTGTNQVTPEIKSKAETFMQLGYQRQLTYKRRDASYSSFGNIDETASPMLTAFVVRSLARTKKYIYIDEKDIKQPVNWLKQELNGFSLLHQNVFNKQIQGGIEQDTIIKAYITIALLESGNKGQEVTDSIDYILREYRNKFNTYSLALITYTLALAEHSRTQEFLTKLKKKVKMQGNGMYWRADDMVKQAPSRTQWWYYQPPSGDVETTGYVFLSLLKTHSGKGFPKNSLKIVRWLSKQRNSFGGFASTQDTCVALQALAEFASKAFGVYQGKPSSSNLNIYLDIKNAFKHQFTVTKKNKLSLKSVEIPENLLPTKLHMKATGQSCGMIQATVKYNIPEPDGISAFDIKVGVSTRNIEHDEEQSLCKPLRLKIKAKWLKREPSNMVVVDLKLASGFQVLEKSLEKLNKNPALDFKRYDIKNKGNNALLYFSEMKDVSFDVDIHQNEIIKDRKPAVITIYDYYQPENMAKYSYNITDQDCYGNRIQLCPNCMDYMSFNDIAKVIGCDSTVARVKSKQNKILLGKGYSKDVKNMKHLFDYKIPEYCMCKELYNDAKALLVIKKKHVDQTNKTMTLSNEANFIKWEPRSMRRKIPKIVKC